MEFFLLYFVDIRSCSVIHTQLWGFFRLRMYVEFNEGLIEGKKVNVTFFFFLTKVNVTLFFFFRGVNVTLLKYWILLDASFYGWFQAQCFVLIIFSLNVQFYILLGWPSTDIILALQKIFKLSIIINKIFDMSLKYMSFIFYFILWA